jgi:NAD-dependent deacetylase
VIQLSKTDHLFVLTGAGISAESGIPTFRDANGLWEGWRFEEVASPEA